MKRGLVLALLMPAVAGCSVGGTTTQTISVTQSSDGTTTRTETTSTSTSGAIIHGVRGALPAQGAFYAAVPDELCAIARTVLFYERDRGATAPIEGLFYDHDIAIGPDCTGVYLAAGLPSASYAGGETRHVWMPRQGDGESVTVAVDYGCGKPCLGGATYTLYRREHEWQVDPSRTSTWIR